jgi:hypothetical protein
MSNSLAATLRSILKSLGTAALVSLIAAPALADDKQLCVPPGDGVPGVGGPPEWITAPANTALDDPRWRGATSQAYGASGAPHSRLRAVHKNNKLYLSFQVHVDADAGLPEDSVFIALAQNATATQHLVRLQLTASTDVTASAASVAVSHFTWSGTAWTGAAPPTWLEDKAAWLTVDSTDGSAEWAINLKIAYTATGLGYTAPFKMWTGTAVQLTSSPTTTYSTYVWPLGTAGPWSGGSAGPPADQAIASTDWGDITIGTAGCTTGVSLTMDNIGVGNSSATTLSSNISTTTNNWFAARPTYNGVSPGVDKVKARFRMANWGSATNWTTIPGFDAVGSNGTTGWIEKECIQGGTPACPTPPSGHNHQCILVEMSAGAPVTFLNDSVYRNMDFVSNSFFERDAEISIKGVPPLPNSKGKRDVYLFVDTTNMPKKTRGPLDDKALRGALQAADDYRRHVYHTNPKLQPKAGDKALPPAPQIKSSKTPHELLKTVWPTYEVHVYYDTGKELTVGTKKGKRLTAAPSFGFFVHHAGDLEGWLQDMVGLNATLVKIGPNFYKVEIPDNGSIKLVNRIEGIIPGRPPTLSQIGKPGTGGGTGGGTTEPPPVCKECPKVTPGPHGCGSCRVIGMSSRFTDVTSLSLLALAGILWRRRRSSRKAS